MSNDQISLEPIASGLIQFLSERDQLPPEEIIRRAIVAYWSNPRARHSEWRPDNLYKQCNVSLEKRFKSKP